MSLGAWIFLSAIFLGLVALFIATRGQWNWGKIVTWPWKKIIIRIAIVVTSLILLVAIVSGGRYIYLKIAERPRVQKSLWGLTLDLTKEDVKFLKGTPTKDSRKVRTHAETKALMEAIRAGKTIGITHQSKSDTELDFSFLETGVYKELSWYYEFQVNDHIIPFHLYQIVFRDNKISIIGGKGEFCDNIQNIKPGDSYELVKRFGKPSYTSYSKDGLSRIVSFKKYHVFFELEKGLVSGVGIYNPSFGDVKFINEKSDRLE